MANYEEYKKDLDRFFDDLDLRKRDVEVSESAKREAGFALLKNAIAVLVKQIGCSEEDALQIVKETPRGREYFGA